MSDNYQHYHHPPHQPPPYQHGAPPPGYGHPVPPVPGGPAPRRARPWWALVALVAVLAVGGVVVTTLGGGGDDEGPGDGEPRLTTHPTLEPLGFPDALALDYEAGPDAACAAVSETMLARNYELQSADSEDGGVDCWYNTPAASTLDDGTYRFTANVYMSVGEVAGPAYDRFTSVMRSNVGGGGTDMVWSPLYELPVGDEGWIVHNQNLAAGLERGDGTASFRQGDTTFYVLVYGWTVRHAGPSEPLTEETTFREITDIVRSLGGDTSAGAPQLSASPAQEYPGLEDFGDPMLPLEGSGQERCAALTAVVTSQLDGQVMGEVVDDGPEVTIPVAACNYEPAEAAYGQEGVAIRNIRLSVRDYTTSEVMYPAGELGSQLRSTMDNLRDSAGAGPLYTLPAGTSGYLVYEDDGGGHGFLDAGYVVGDRYVAIQISGFHNAGGFDTRALTEEELVGDLSTLLTAMNG
ncbi:hypothetical protein [Streptomyces hainanensis]|uniref:Uncharacterized protein n=1 Tax=Streptomyces hainanensis TaxID=402648 RepID=A0A4V2Y4B3_9ACTN|nr:hypothetical protein [Streptomyces hainanensis]TDC79715.1 hypothetical protein E1283_02205 [Streptomyces hainanensis]